MLRKPWKDFTNLTSQSFVTDLVPAAKNVAPEDLCDMAEYRKAERMSSCGGHDPIRTLVAYAQNELIYDETDRIIPVEFAVYATIPRQRRVNKFGLSYRRDAKLWLHKTLADIVVGAAVHLHQTQSWTTTLYDGLRTIDGAYKLYLHAHDSDMESRLLSLPGQSAHNKGMAVDSMMSDAMGREIDMGGHFDHLDMSTNGRTYGGDNISDLAKKCRLIREAAFLRSAFLQGLLIAPLRNEFWDDRLPENREDLWRVLDSAARSIGLTLLSPEDEKLRRENRKAFCEKWERWSYADFLARWAETFRGHESALEKMLGVTSPPLKEKPEFYHGNYNPIYDSS
jgi:hypothetical protein